MGLYQGSRDKLLGMIIQGRTEVNGVKPVVLRAKQTQEGGGDLALPILDAGARKGGGG